MTLVKRTMPGRYYGLGASHSYLIERDAGGWSLTITRTVVVAEIQITDPDARGSKSWHGHLATARTVANLFEQLGDDYEPYQHGHRERHTEAVQRAYAAEIDRGQ